MLTGYNIDITKDYVAAIIINTNTNSIVFTDDEIYSFNINESACADNKFSVGNTISNSIALKLININADGSKNKLFSNNYKGTKLEVLALYSNGTEIPLGIFYADDISKEGAITTLSGMDKLGTVTYAIKYNSHLNWEENHSLRDIAQEIAPTSNYSSIPDDIMVEEKPVGYTKREMLGYVAGCCGMNVHTNRLGEVEFFKFGENTDKAKLNSQITYNIKINDNASVVSSVYAKLANGEETSCDNKDLIADDINAIEVEVDNPIMYTDSLYNLWSSIGGFKYYAFNYEGLANPLIEIGDAIIIEDEDGNIYKSVVFEQEFNYNGNFTQSIETTTDSNTSNETSSRVNSTDKKVNAAVNKAVEKAIDTNVIEITKQEIVAADTIEATAAFIDDLQVERIATNLKDYICTPNLTKIDNTLIWTDEGHTFKARNKDNIRGYIKMEGLSQQFIEAHLIEPGSYEALTTDEVQPLLINNRQLYYTSIEGAQAFEYLTFVSPRSKYSNLTSEQETMYKVYTRKILSEYIKMEQSFVLESGTYNVKTVYGTGDKNGNGKYYFVKDTDSGRFVYVSRADSKEYGIAIKDDAVYNVTAGKLTKIYPVAVMSDISDTSDLPIGTIIFKGEVN